MRMTMTNKTSTDKFFEALKEVLDERAQKEKAGEWYQSEDLPTLEEFLSSAKDMPFQEVLDMESAPIVHSVKVLDNQGVGFEFVGKFTYMFTEDFDKGTNLIVKAVKE